MTRHPEGESGKEVSPLKVVRQEEGSDGPQEPEILEIDPEQEKEKAETEQFWAGRNLAMRRSARIAA